MGQNRKRKARWWVVISVLAVLMAGTVPGATADEDNNRPIDIQILNVSDWHAQLDPFFDFGLGTNVGGAAVLSAYWQAERIANPNTLTLTAGDAFGASPPLSGFFDEVPAVLAMNLMGFDVDTFGNHNFDRGTGHLQGMIELAEFQYVAANLQNRDDNLTGVKDFEIFEFEGRKIAVIGIVNPEAPTLVFPGSFGTIEVTDPVEAATEARSAAKAAGAKTFVAVTHLGVTNFDDDGNPIGPLIDFANGVKGFDVIFGDHTGAEFAGMVNGALVVENRSKGRTYARVTLSVNNGGNVVKKGVEFVDPIASAVTPDPAIEAMLAPFRAELAVALDEVIGVATDIFPRGGSPQVERSGEAALGNVVTDSMRLRYSTQIAVTNGGGLRDPLPSPYLPADTSLRRTAAPYVIGPPYDLVKGDALELLPFGNSVVTRTVTGSQLYAVLERGVSALPCTACSGRFAQISGFSFEFNSTFPVGSRVVSVTLNGGTPILPDATVYTMATNDFMNAGGDGYTMLADGEGTTRDPMLDVFIEYVQTVGTITPVIEGRIVDLAP